MNPGADDKIIACACSGCSDAGELADRLARRLTRDGVAEMSCLAGISGQVRSLVAKAESAAAILVIDGCPLACGKKTLELAGFANFHHLRLDELGFRKGACPVTEPRVAAGVAAVTALLHGQAAARPVTLETA